MNNRSFITNIEKLVKCDRSLAKIIETRGYPEQFKREPGFVTLLRIILEQQVSYNSAQATFKRLNDAVVDLNPASFLTLDDAELKAIGFSRQKTKYGRILAQTIRDGELDLASLSTASNQEVRSKLTSLKGIGDWTVNIYLMMALQRQDVFPAKDLAVAIAVQEIKNLPNRPTVKELEEIAQSWKPYRAIATQILWHYRTGKPACTSLPKYSKISPN